MKMIITDQEIPECDARIVKLWNKILFADLGNKIWNLDLTRGG